MITPHACYRATCTRCGTAWAEALDYEPHWDTVVQARAALGALGWFADWCPTCLAERLCERLGCHWGEPITGPDPHPAAYQYCTRCGNARLIALEAS